MVKVHCPVPGRCVNPLFEVFDGGDFVLSSYRDVESDAADVAVYLEDAAQAAEAARRLEAALAVVGCDAAVETADVPDEDWKFAYRRHFKTEPIGRRLVSVPTWELDAFENSRDPALAGRLPIVLDPGLAFGTGKHETTRACLEYIDELAASIRPGEGRSFLDMGCGSGILSIAAAKLGFAPVAGFDIDDAAVEASRENAALNGVDVAYHSFALGGGAFTLDESIEAAKGVYPDLALQARATKAPSPVGPADLVAANILGTLLVAFAREIAGYAKKALIVSGILSTDCGEVLAAFAPLGFDEVSRKEIGEWTTALLVRRAI
ncbi:MAG: 50S ribosomal protein L11 methyltransferase [Kiritimatiellae bacterium]|nr:50S ribosomal protein L11 methyltransferase [Kiritimatiellia bacterium]